jgi:hypothetical protein
MLRGVAPCVLNGGPTTGLSSLDDQHDDNGEVIGPLRVVVDGSLTACESVAGSDVVSKSFAALVRDELSGFEDPNLLSDISYHPGLKMLNSVPHLGVFLKTLIKPSGGVEQSDIALELAVRVFVFCASSFHSMTLSLPASPHGSCCPDYPSRSFR